jgi:predicted site-specific integrase-resolvase
MNGNNSHVTTRKAGEITGFSSRHMQNFIKAGKLSATRDENGNYLIDKAELYRLFPHAHQEKQEEKSKEISREILEAEIKHLREMNSFLNKQLETATAEKTMLLETLNSNQKFLEYSNKWKRKRFLGIF